MLTADAEVGVDEQQGFNGQILKFQVPGGVIGRDMADVLHVVLAEPLPGIVIVQIGHPGGVTAPAAEFSDVVAQGCGADEGQVYREARLLCKQGRMHRHIVHTDGMGGRVKGLQLPSQAQQRHQMSLAHRQPEACVFGRRVAVFLLLRFQGQKICQRVKFLHVLRKQGFQHQQVQPLPLRQLRRFTFRENTAAQPVVQLPQPCLAVAGSLQPGRAEAPNAAAQIRLVTGKGQQRPESLRILQQRTGAGQLRLRQLLCQCFGVEKLHDTPHFPPQTQLGGCISSFFLFYHSGARIARKIIIRCPDHMTNCGGGYPRCRSI